MERFCSTATNQSINQSKARKKIGMIMMNRFFVVDQFGKNLVTQFQILFFFLFIHWLYEGQIDTRKNDMFANTPTHQYTQ